MLGKAILAAEEIFPHGARLFPIADDNSDRLFLLVPANGSPSINDRRIMNPHAINIFKANTRQHAYIFNPTLEEGATLSIVNEAKELVAPLWTEAIDKTAVDGKESVVRITNRWYNTPEGGPAEIVGTSLIKWRKYQAEYRLPSIDTSKVDPFSRTSSASQLLSFGNPMVTLKCARAPVNHQAAHKYRSLVYLRNKDTNDIVALIEMRFRSLPDTDYVGILYILPKAKLASDAQLSFITFVATAVFNRVITTWSFLSIQERIKEAENFVNGLDAAISTIMYLPFVPIKFEGKDPIKYY
ncbi:hypothetical protein GQ42DRAFT_153799 [Ramicandelaber brevisporus]|nr:hypothetical protein GQ42DRAFT_153799 [Ramicandelaber brevisporus]